jgi:hypothetical protein
MLALAAVAPGIVTRAVSTVPHPLGPRADLLATLTILIIGLFLIAVAVRSVIKE